MGVASGPAYKSAGAIALGHKVGPFTSRDDHAHALSFKRSHGLDVVFMVFSVVDFCPTALLPRTRLIEDGALVHAAREYLRPISVDGKAEYVLGMTLNSLGLCVCLPVPYAHLTRGITRNDVATGQTLDRPHYDILGASRDPSAK